MANKEEKTAVNAAIDTLRAKLRQDDEGRAQLTILQEGIKTLRQAQREAGTAHEQHQRELAAARRRMELAEAAAKELREALAVQRQGQQQAIFNAKNVPFPAQAHLEKLVAGPVENYDTSRDPDGRVAALMRLVPRYLDTFANMVQTVPVLAFHQDSFAATYAADEYTLLGMLIKYAGEHGVTVRISGRNRETAGKGTKQEQIELQHKLQIADMLAKGETDVGGPCVTEGQTMPYWDKTAKPHGQMIRKPLTSCAIPIIVLPRKSWWQWLFGDWP